MARFHGEVGYGAQVEVASGVWEDVVTERTYFGDVVRNHRKFNEGETVNDDLSLLSNSISIVSDNYANEHIFAIRYVKWAGSRWKVTDVEIDRPRLILRLGGIYNGNTPSPPESP